MEPEVINLVNSEEEGGEGDEEEESFGESGSDEEDDDDDEEDYEDEEDNSENSDDDDEEHEKEQVKEEERRRRQRKRDMSKLKSESEQEEDSESKSEPDPDSAASLSYCNKAADLAQAENVKRSRRQTKVFTHEDYKNHDSNSEGEDLFKKDILDRDSCNQKYLCYNLAAIDDCRSVLDRLKRIQGDLDIIPIDLRPGVDIVAETRGNLWFGKRFLVPLKMIHDGCGTQGSNREAQALWVKVAKCAYNYKRGNKQKYPMPWVEGVPIAVNQPRSSKRKCGFCDLDRECRDTLRLGRNEMYPIGTRCSSLAIRLICFFRALRRCVDAHNTETCDEASVEAVVLALDKALGNVQDANYHKSK